MNENVIYDKDNKPSLTTVLKDLNTYSLIIENGERPCSVIAAPIEYVIELEEYMILKFPNLQWYMEPVTDTEYTAIYIYKYAHVKSVISNRKNIPEAVRDWYDCKLFGMNDRLIEKFINHKNDGTLKDIF